MKIKKISALILAVITLVSFVAVSAFAEETPALPEHFKFGDGPETEGFSIDYRYFSPVKENDSTKYPLVVWLHGMGDGEYDGKQVITSDINKWTSEEFQGRFKGSEGAFILAPRSIEEQKLYWTNDLIYPLRAAIDDFIEKNKANIDLKRIYIGGYSMGGKMTLKMATAYPEMFAAAFPICPAWVPGEDATVHLKDMPIWLTSGAPDPLVNYFTFVTPTWKNIISQSNVPESCRFSTLILTLYPNGRLTQSSHFSWFSVNNDMFSSKNGDYPLMKIRNGLGEKIELTYPDGMISWLSGFESDFDGAKATNSGNSEAHTSSGQARGFDLIKEFFINFFEYIAYIIGLK